jgi:hypothetical protein
VSGLLMPDENIECPLCLGEGTLKRTEVLDRLGVKDFARVAQLSAEEAFRLLRETRPRATKRMVAFRNRTHEANGRDQRPS